MGFMDFFKRKSSGDVAKDRLKLLLVSDRANCSPDVMELIKNDIIKPKGTGIESILMAIDKYDGNIRYQMEDGILTACVILNC